MRRPLTRRPLPLRLLTAAGALLLLAGALELHPEAAHAVDGGERLVLTCDHDGDASSLHVEAFVPPSVTESWAAFAFEELAVTDQLRLQLGGPQPDRRGGAQPRLVPQGGGAAAGEGRQPGAQGGVLRRLRSARRRSPQS